MPAPKTVLPPETSAEIPEWQKPLIEEFAQTARLLGLPKSIGEIYGLYFCASQPLCYEDVVQLLGISKGSASQGMQVLRKLGALKKAEPHNIENRRDYYLPETKLKKLASKFFHHQLLPHLERSNKTLKHVESAIAELPEEAQALAKGKHKLLQAWQGQIKLVQPMLSVLLGKS